MGYTDIIAREANSLPMEEQKKVLDFIEFLKVWRSRTRRTSTPKTAEENEVFFRSLNVDMSDYKFEREDANAR